MSDREHGSASEDVGDEWDSGESDGGGGGRLEPHDLILRAPPNWMAVSFIALLGSLHLMISIHSLTRGRWEGYLSLAFGTSFVTAALVGTRCRYELAVLGSQRRVRLRTGLKIPMFCHERTIPFALIQRVRLTLMGGSRPTESLIELLCAHEDIQCPPTRIPRQEALYLAMAIGVPLIKVSDEPAPASTPQQLDAPSLLDRPGIGRRA